MSGVNNGWARFFNEEHQLPYYYNAETGESLWECPEGFVEEADPAAGGAAPDNGRAEAGPSAELTCLGDAAFYALDDRLAFLDEMHRMGFMMTPPDEEVVFIFSGSTSEPLKKKLEALEAALQTAGTDEDWATVLRADGMALLRYLTCFLAPSVHIELSEIGARCLAYTGNIFPSLWTEYCASDDGGVGTRVVVGVVKNATARLVQIIAAFRSQSARRSSLTHGTYAGFDVRDVKEFGLTGMQEVVDAYHASRGEASMDAEQMQTSMLILLMIICKCLESPSAWIQQEVDLYRKHGLADKHGEALEGRDEDAEALVSSLLGTVRLLYNLLRTVQEDVYLGCIKAIAHINAQFPSRGVESSAATEVAELCCKMKFDEAAASHSAATANLAEGLLHLVNDIGYPSHDVPEAVPVLELCRALTCVPEYDGYFYTNDVKVLAEVIIRELANMPHMEGGTVFAFPGTSEERTFKIREIYVRLSGALVDHTLWSTAGEKHKFDEVRAVLEDCLRDQLPDQIREEFEVIASKFY